jgi:DnaJ-class molecular chaperone
MKKIRTHYDNLKVSRDAPAEVIRAAYKSLAAKYHPDKNKNSPASQRTMKIINESYAVLSDPEQRRIHDAWIADKEVEDVDFSPKEQIFTATTAEEEQKPVVPIKKIPSSTGFFFLSIIVIVIIISMGQSSEPSSRQLDIDFNKKQDNASQPQFQPQTMTQGVASTQQVVEQQSQTQTQRVASGWSVRLGSFSNADNATALLARLQANGYIGYTRQLESSQGTLTTLFIGPLPDWSTAQTLRERLRQDIQLNGMIVRYEI